MATAITSDHGRAGPSSKRRDGERAFIAALACLGASFANFLRYHDYPLLKPEVALVVLGLTLFAVTFALLHCFSPRIVKALLEGFIVYLAVDLNADVPNIAAGLAGLAAVLRLFTGLSLLTPLTIISGVVLASAAVGLSDEREAMRTSLHPVPAAKRTDSVLHILLDEHGGPGGADPALRSDLITFYVGHGFRLFDRGYARHTMTVNAVPDALNFGRPGTSRNINESLDVGPTSLLTLYQQRGYRLHIYQSDFADYCRYQMPASCTAYWSPSLRFIAATHISAIDKARLMLYKFAHLSDLATMAADQLRKYALQWDLIKNPRAVPSIELAGRSGTLSGLAILDRMAMDAANAKPGDAIFAHVLAPHYPYVADAGCNLVSPVDWGYRRPDNRLTERRTAYRNQVRCVTKKVDAVIASYLASTAGKNGTIVIHGDHGSRIALRELADWNRNAITRDDLMAGYSTLLAVRGPAIKTGLDLRPTANADLLETLARNDFRSLDGLPRGQGLVHLTGPGWTIGTAISIDRAWPDQRTPLR